MKYMKNNKKGFTMVELLATVLILGVLTLIAIFATVKYIDKAKEEKTSQNMNTIKIAAESYAQSNKSYVPKQIGESTKIDLSELEDAKYIKEEIKNNNDESCMENSYVIITKISENEYAYKPYLLCGSETKPEVEIKTSPEIKIVILDSSGNNITNSPDVMSARFSITFIGDTNDENVGIMSYTYSLMVKKYDQDNNGMEPEFFEVFNSGNLKGNKENIINVENIPINKYIDITGKSDVLVKAHLINDKGDSVDDESVIKIESSSGTFVDNQPPICPALDDYSRRSGEPQEDEWLNKKEVFNKSVRRISLTCDDKQGSGCKRQEFTKTWPNKKDPETIKEGIIEMEDNSKYSTASECKVRVNIDRVSPTLTLQAENGINHKVTAKNINKNEVTEDNIYQAVEVESTDEYYNNLHDGWLNKNKYPNRALYSIEVSDDVDIKKIEWLTNAANQTEATFSKDFDFESTDNYIDENVIEDNYETIVKNDKTYYYFKVSFGSDGKRYGRLRVYDQAGNYSELDIYANIDIEAPDNITTSYYKWNDNNNHPKKADIPDLSRYELDTWSKYKVYTVASGATDFISGVNHYEYTTTGRTTNHENYENDSRSIEAQGISYITYRACDNAGNCSAYPDPATIKVDYTDPVCTNIVTCDGNDCTKWLGFGKTLTITARCSEKTSSVEVSGCKVVDVKTKTYNRNTNTTTAGADGENKEVVVEDNAGNKATCKADKTVKIDHNFPTCEQSIKKNKNSNYTSGTWLKKGEYATLYGRCKDTGGSGCKTEVETKEIKTNTNGNVSLGKTVEDNAGNKTTCNQNFLLKLDVTAPTVSCNMNNKTLNEKSVSDSFGVTSKSYVITTSSKAPSSGWSSSIPTAPTTCGTTYYGYIKASDAAGNTTTQSCGSYTNDSCCDSSHPEKCPWVTTCRYGITCVLDDPNSVCDDVVCHGDVPLDYWGEGPGYGCGGSGYNSYTKLYLVKRYDSMSYVCYKGGDGGSLVTPSSGWHCGYVFNNCLNKKGEENRVCEYKVCPG